MNYKVSVSGGRGAHEWHNEIKVEATSVRDALDKVEAFDDGSGEVIAIEPADD